jgi:recombination protein RecT
MSEKTEKNLQVVPQKPVRALEQLLTAHTPALKEWAAGRVNPAALIRWALLEYSQSEALQRCTPESIYLALIACAQFGLEPSGIRQQAFIVPFKRTAVFMPGYRGFIDLARRAKVRLVPHVVYENDLFELDYISDKLVVHKPALHDRGPLIGAYAWARLPDDEYDAEWMDLDELEHVREMANRVRGGDDSPAYKDWPDQMYRKAPIRRIAKRLPAGEEMARAVAIDTAVDTGDLRSYKNFIDVKDELPELGTQLEEVPETRGVAGAKAQLRSRGAKQTPASESTSPLDSSPAPADHGHHEGTIELAEHIRSIYRALEHILEHPERLPSLRAQVEAVPDCPDRPVLLGQLVRAERLAKEDAAAATDPRGA